MRTVKELSEYFAQTEHPQLQELIDISEWLPAPDLRLA